mmetsp:Transcript_8931/g.22313  ORF Transcript_8931/g.22313 Transcript_8931/m.22313 type:complete len:198 (+) Transcript_8931:254-847(+)
MGRADVASRARANKEPMATRKRTLDGSLVGARAAATAASPGDDNSVSSVTSTVNAAEDHQLSHSGSEHEDHDLNEFGDEEKEAASSLATFILAASNAVRPRKAQPHSAPPALSVTSTDNEENGSADPISHKKQRRREKNRASAQQSRQRKKFHLETLEQRVEQLEGERTALQLKLQALMSENTQLREQLDTPGTSAE